MPNPKRRHSKSRQRKRRTHYKASAPALTACANCGEPVQPHHVCPNCGYYRGKQAIEVS